MMTQLFHYGKNLLQDHVVIDCAFFWGKQFICILDCLLFCFVFLLSSTKLLHYVSIMKISLMFAILLQRN